MIVEISCVEVRRRVSDIVDGEIDGELSQRIALHLINCRQCSAVVKGVRNLVDLMGDPRVFHLPQGYAIRVYLKVEHFLQRYRT